ncbi:hypothetical protein ABPG74_007563 [Tetrahymena malaccensis]
MNIQSCETNIQTSSTDDKYENGSKPYEGYIEIIINSKSISKKKKKKELEISNKNYGGQCQYKMINYQSFLRCLNQKKLFHLAGGLLIDVSDPIQQVPDYSFYNVCKIVKFSNKFKDGSVQFQMGCLDLTFDYDMITNILYSTQNEENFILANILAQAKPKIMLVKETIDVLYLQYNIQDIEYIAHQRNLYLEQFKKQYLEQNQSEEDFYSVTCYSLDIHLKSLFSSFHQFSKSLIALFGVETEEMISHGMKKSIFWMFSKNTRKRMMKGFALILISQINQIYHTYFPNTEILTIDEISVTCSSDITIVPINYPAQLQFQGEKFANINQSDYLITIKYEIPPNNIKNLIKIREAKIQSQGSNIQNFYLWKDLDEYAANNFESYMQNLIFLEKFYSDEKNVQQCKEKKQLQISDVSEVVIQEPKVCNYRPIKNFQASQ